MHVRSRDTGAMREWNARHGVEFALNGKVKYKWPAPSSKQVASEWHLKEGDKTTAERAARVYFDCRVMKEKLRLLFLRWPAFARWRI